MTARLLIAFAMLASILGASGIALRQELARASATPAYLPVQARQHEMGWTTAYLDEPLEDPRETFWRDDDGDKPIIGFLLELDGDGRAIASEAVRERPPVPTPERVFVRAGPDGRYVDTTWPAPADSLDATAYLHVRVDPTGTVFGVGFVDEALNPLGRGDAAW